MARRQLVEDTRLRPRPDERAQFADLPFQALEPPHLAAEADDLVSANWERVGVSCSGLCYDERDAAGETPLILAAERGDAPLARALLGAGADAAAASYSGWTALHGAAERGSVPVIELLAAAGADVSARAESGKTPLDIARQYEKPEAAAALGALGASANLSG